MPTRDALAARTADAITAASPLLERGDYRGYMDEVRRVVTRGHLAASLAAAAERDGGPDARGLLRRILTLRPVRDRIALAARLNRELTYLDRFARAAPSLSPAQIAARAQLYAGAVRGTYDRARLADWDIPEHLWPGNQRCRGNCRCTLDVRDLGGGNGELTRRLRPAEHCPDCVALAGTYRIRRRRL